MGTIISVAAFIILIILVVVCVKKLLLMCRNLRNTVRGYMGKDSAESEKAAQLLTENAKNGLIPKWAVDEAISTMKKFYTPESSMQSVADYMSASGLKYADFPKSMYVAPGASKEMLNDHCAAYFAKFNYKKMDKDNAMTDKDYEVMNQLNYCWYFADNSVSTLQEAGENVRSSFGYYCEKNKPIPG